MLLTVGGISLGMALFLGIIYTEVRLLQKEGF